MSQQFEIGLMWFRRDLRVTDNAALHMALKACRQLHCVFVFDRDILDGLPGLTGAWSSFESLWLNWTKICANSAAITMPV